MIFALLFASQTIALSVPINVKDNITLRWQVGVKPSALKMLPLLRRCARKNRLVADFTHSLEFRIVSQAWLNSAFPLVKQQRRTGRYFPAQNGHPALIYLADGDETLLSLAHEWLHHLTELSAKNWNETKIEASAKRCWRAP
jgi:hypothetical protein